MSDKKPIDYTVLKGHPSDFLLGVLDVMAGIGILAIQAGLLSREALIELCDNIEKNIDHQIDQSGIGTEPDPRDARKGAVRIMRGLFAAPTVGDRRAFKVVNGGGGPKDAA